MTPDILAVVSSDGAGAATVLTVVGEIDRDSREQLRRAAEAALERGRRRLILDLSAVTFCDSGGLSLLVDLHRRTRERDGWLRLVAVPPYLGSIFRITRLERLFDCRDTVEAAADRP